MNCPKCKTRMTQVDLAQLQQGKVFIAFECPACHYRAQEEK